MSSDAPNDLATTLSMPNRLQADKALAFHAALLSRVLLYVEQLPVEERTRILMDVDRLSGLSVRVLLERLAFDINAITPIASLLP